MNVINKFIRFGLIGGIITIFHFSIASIFYIFLNQNVIIANQIAFIIASFLSFILNAFFTFNQKPNLIFLFKFACIVGLNFGATTLIAYLGNKFKLGFYIVSFMIVVILPISSFLIHNFWTFKGE